MLSRKQYQKLFWISFFNGTTAKNYYKRKDLYTYLFTEGYLLKCEVRGYNGYIVSEKGRAAMYAFKCEHFRFWFPSAVSLFALASSILSLATTNPDFWQDVQKALEYLRSLILG